MGYLITSDASFFNAHSYDYIVIGGGTAGLVVASRLAENPSIKVGVLEAGHHHPDSPFINIPVHAGSLVGNDEFDWGFETTDQAGLGGRRLPWPRGKVLGGTSALNLLVWNRAAKSDYDTWEKLGNPGWDWESLLPFFKKSETLHPATEAHQNTHHSVADVAFHGTAGPVATSFPPWFAATHAFWHATLESLGIPKNASALNGSNIGAWTCIQSVDPMTAERSYSASAYLGDKSRRETLDDQSANLVILTGALTQRILIDNDRQGGLRATGAEYSHDGKTFTAKAGREVILSAGTVQSPQLLELSGIGDGNILTKAGVEVKFENKNVGRNLQDHLMTSLVYELKPGVTTTEDLVDPVFRAAAEKAYSEEKDGIYRSSPSSMVYLPLKTFTSAEKLQDLYTRTASATMPELSPTLKNLLVEQLCDEKVGHVEFVLHHGNSGPFTGEDGKRYATLHQIQQYPFARGEIHIETARISDKPAINPAYYSPVGLPDGLSFSPDLEIITAGAIFAAQVPSQPPLSSIIEKRVFPPEGDVDGAPVSEEDWTTFVRDTTITDWHPIGTCAMLPFEDGGVVDARLRVYGVRGLRVIDASVLPHHISSHLQATVYAVAEKGAALIKEDQ